MDTDVDMESSNENIIQSHKHESHDLKLDSEMISEPMSKTIPKPLSEMISETVSKPKSIMSLEEHSKSLEEGIEYISEYSDYSSSSIPLKTIQTMIDDFNNFASETLLVKLFSLDSSKNQWIKNGIGIISLEYYNSKNIYILIKTRNEIPSTTEEDCSSILFETSIFSNTNYSLDTTYIISWIDSYSSKCISFSDESSCDFLWSIFILLIPNLLDNDHLDPMLSNDTSSNEDEDLLNDQNELLEEENNQIESCNALSDNSTLENSIYVKNDTQEDIREFSGTDYFQLESQKDENKNVWLNTLLEKYQDTKTISLTKSESPEFQLSNIKIKIPLPKTIKIIKQLVNRLKRIHQLLSDTSIKRSFSYQPDERIILNQVTQKDWLSTLWALLDKQISSNKINGCTIIAKFLCRLIVVYIIVYHPYYFLSQGPYNIRNQLETDPLCILLSDDHFLYLFRALKYEPSRRKYCNNIDYEDYIKNSCQHIQVICKNDKTVRNACNFLYRLRYIQDVYFPLILDENLAVRFSALSLQGFSYICRLITSTPNSIRELGEMINEDVLAAHFLLEFLSSHPFSRDDILEADDFIDLIKNENVLESLEGYLTGVSPAIKKWEYCRNKNKRETQDHINNNYVKTKNPDLHYRDRITYTHPQELAVEILHYAVMHNVSLVRNIILHQAIRDPTGRPIFFLALCDLFLVTNNQALHIQLADIFRKLVNISTVDNPERDDFLAIFYDKGVIEILADILMIYSPITINDLIMYINYNKTLYFLPSLKKLVDLENDQDLFEFHKLRDLTNETDGNLDFLSGDIPIPYTIGLEDTQIVNTTDTTNTNEYNKCRSTIENNNKELQTVSQPNCVLDTYSVSDNNTYDRCADGLIKKSNSKILSNSTDILSDELPTPDFIKKNIIFTKLKNILENLTEIDKEKLLLLCRHHLSFVKCEISEILTLCVITHKYRIKYLNLKRNLQLNLLQMSYSPILDPFLAIHAIKFLRICLATEADYYVRIFIRHSILFHILVLMKKITYYNLQINGGDESLLESVILEFFTFILNCASESSSIASLVKTMFDLYGQDWDYFNNYYTGKSHYNVFYQLRLQYNTICRSGDRYVKCLDRMEDDFLSGVTQYDSSPQSANKQLKSVSNEISAINDAETERFLEDSYFWKDDSETYLSGNGDTSNNSSKLDSPSKNNDLNSLHDNSKPLDDTEIFLYSSENDTDIDVPNFMKRKVTSDEIETLKNQKSQICASKTSKSIDIILNISRSTTDVNTTNYVDTPRFNI